MAVKLMPLFRFFVKEKKFEKSLAERKAEMVVISSTEDNHLELKHLLGSSDCINLSFVSFEDVKNLDEQTMKAIEGADVTVIYSKKPLAELPDVAFSLYAVKSITFRYFCLLYGSNSLIAAGILKDGQVANPCRICPSSTKDDLLKELRRNLSKTAPLESVPSMLKLEIYDGYRDRESTKALLKFFLRFYLLYTIFPPVALYYLHEFFAVVYLLLKNLTAGSTALNSMAKVAVLLVPSLFGKKKRTNIPAIIPAALLLLLLLVELPASAVENEQ